MVFKQLDPETKDWGKETPVSSRAWNILPPAMMSMPISLWITAISLANAGTTARSRKSLTGWPATWTATISTADQFGFLSDGRIVAVTYDYSDNGPSKQQILVLNRVDAASVTTKTELTLACLYLGLQPSQPDCQIQQDQPDTASLSRTIPSMRPTTILMPVLPNSIRRSFPAMCPIFIVNGTELPSWSVCR